MNKTRRIIVHFFYITLLLLIASSYYHVFYDFAVNSSTQLAAVNPTADLQKEPKVKIYNMINYNITYRVDTPHPIPKFKYIIIHHTDGHESKDKIKSLRHCAQVTQTKKDRGDGASYYYGYHFCVDKDGSVAQIAPLDTKRTNHIKSKGRGRTHLGANNDNSLGISMIGMSTDASPIQKRMTIELARSMQARYNIPSKNIFGHYEVDTEKNPIEGVEVAKILRGMPQPEGGGLVKIASKQEYYGGNRITNGQTPPSNYVQDRASGSADLQNAQSSPAGISPSTSGGGGAAAPSPSDVQAPLQMESYGTPPQDGDYKALDSEKGWDDTDDAWKEKKATQGKDDNGEDWGKEVSDKMLDPDADTKSADYDSDEDLAETGNSTGNTEGDPTDSAEQSANEDSANSEDDKQGGAQTDTDGEPTGDGGNSYNGVGRNESAIDRYVEGFSLGTDIALQKITGDSFHRARNLGHSNYSSSNNMNKYKSFTVSDIFGDNKTPENLDPGSNYIVGRYNPADPNLQRRGWTKDGRRVVNEDHYRRNFTLAELANQQDVRKQRHEQVVERVVEKKGFFGRLADVAKNAGQQMRSWFSSKLEWL